MMTYVPPMISGAGLFVVAVFAMFLKLEIQLPLMLLFALAAVLISLPAIKKFQFTKEGFSIEPAERGHPRGAESHGSGEIPIAKTDSYLNVPIGRLAMGLFYGAISGVMSAITAHFSAPFFPAPPVPALFYSAALLGLFVRRRSIDRRQLVLIPVVVYVAWTAGFRTAAEIFDQNHPQELSAVAISGVAGGLVGAFLLALGLCIIIRELRSPMAILTITGVGGITGALLTLGSQQIGSFGPAPFPLFIGWQSCVTLSIAFFMTDRSKDLVQKAAGSVRNGAVAFHD
jgi:hypothetical protein